MMESFTGQHMGASYMLRILRFCNVSSVFLDLIHSFPGVRCRMQEKDWNSSAGLEFLQENRTHVHVDRFTGTKVQYVLNSTFFTSQGAL